MAGPPSTPQRARHLASWPRELHHSGLLLAAGGALFWMSFVFGNAILWIPNVGAIHIDLVLAWTAVLFDIAAWPSLWVGLRDLCHRRPGEKDPILAWRAFVLSLALAISSLAILPLEYRGLSSPWTVLLLIYLSAFPYLVWTFVPILALHGIIFARVGRYLDPRSRHLTRIGAILLFAVALATSLVVLGNPGDAIFLRAWSAGKGLLPAAAGFGYLLIGWSMTLHAIPEPRPTRGWGAAITPRRSLPWVR
jgi:hypothetical protein